jgi:very-short-patch-repair endonuclease
MNLASPDSYLDQLIAASGPDHAPVGPLRKHCLAWERVAAGLAADAYGARAVAERLALTQGFVVTRAQARAAGLSDAQVRSLLRRRSWNSPRRSVLSPLGPRGGEGPAASSDEVEATAAAVVRPRTVISHDSAAVLHGIPLLRPPKRPTLTAGRGSGYQTCTREDVRIHVAGLWRADVDAWFGAPVTAVARTVMDLARLRGVAQGLMAADAALHEQLTTPRELRAALRRQRGWPGVRRARQVVEAADGLAESPLESLTRLCLREAGLPAPELQAWVDTPGGRYRVDFLWRGQKVILEADGMAKYAGNPTALADEKRRQEHLERAGYRVIRVLWEDVVRHPAQTAARVRAVLTAAAATR